MTSNFWFVKKLKDSTYRQLNTGTEYAACRNMYFPNSNKCPACRTTKFLKENLIGHLIRLIRFVNETWTSLGIYSAFSKQHKIYAKINILPESPKNSITAPRSLGARISGFETKWWQEPNPTLYTYTCSCCPACIHFLYSTKVYQCIHWIRVLYSWC